MASATAIPLSDEINTTLRTLGYKDRGDGGVEGRCLFAMGPSERRTHMLSLCPEHGDYWCAQLAFRDHLRAHPEARREYASLKRRLARAHPGDRSLYTEEKSAFVAQILALTRP